MQVTKASSENMDFQNSPLWSYELRNSIKKGGKSRIIVDYFGLFSFTSKITKMLGCYFIMAPYLKELPTYKYEVRKENEKRGAKIHL